MSATNPLSLARLSALTLYAQQPIHKPTEIDDVEALDGCMSDEPERWLLIEHGTGGYGNRRWFTTHATALAARLYHQHQEYREDWAIAALLDLDAPVTDAGSEAPAGFAVTVWVEGPTIKTEEDADAIVAAMLEVALPGAQEQAAGLAANVVPS